MQGDVHHGMIARRAFRDACLKIRALGVEQALAAASAIEVRGIKINRKSIGIGRHAAHHEARTRPIGGQAWRLTGRRDRQRSGEFADQPGRAIDLGNKIERLRADRVRRLAILDLGGRRRCIAP